MAIKTERSLDPGWCLQLARRTQRPLSLIRLFLPRPARLQGGLAGQETLERILATLDQQLRCTDLVVMTDASSPTLDIFCPDTDKSGACELAKRLHVSLLAPGLVQDIAITSFPEDGY